jgi:hypothetical protein
MSTPSIRPCWDGSPTRIGLLAGPSHDPRAQHAHGAFQQGLRDLGDVERENVILEYRYTEGHVDRLPALAADRRPAGCQRHVGGAGVRGSFARPHSCHTLCGLGNQHHARHDTRELSIAPPLLRVASPRFGATPHRTGCLPCNFKFSRLVVGECRQAGNCRSRPGLPRGATAALQRLQKGNDIVHVLGSSVELESRMVEFHHVPERGRRPVVEVGRSCR